MASVISAFSNTREGRCSTRSSGQSARLRQHRGRWLCKKTPDESIPPVLPFRNLRQRGDRRPSQCCRAESRRKPPVELAAERLPLYRDPRVLLPVYAHQKFLLHDGGFKELKIHVPTAGGKTLGAVLFALRETFKNPAAIVRTILTYPTNLLSRDQFEHSVVRALTEWVGADTPLTGVIDPYLHRFVHSSVGFEEAVHLGAPTYVFELPRHVASRDLYVTVITGDVLQHLLSA